MFRLQPTRRGAGDAAACCATALLVSLLAARAPAQPAPPPAAPLPQDRGAAPAPVTPDTSAGVAIPASRWRITGDQGRIVAGDRGRVMILTGNVRVVRADLTVTADRARRDLQREETQLAGRVHAVSESLTVWADSVHVIERADRARLFGNVRLQTIDGTAGSGDRGEYLRPEDWLALAGAARVRDAQVVVDADSIAFDRRRSELQAFRSVKIVDDASHTVVTGEHARFDRARGVAWVDSLPVLVTRQQGGATAEVTSRQMTFARTGNTRQAVGDVRFRQGVTQAHADTADFVGDDLLILRGAPQVEQERQVMSGDQIHIRYADGELRRIDVYGKARLRDSSPDSLGRVLSGIPLANELSGDTLQIDVAHAEVTHTHVHGSARSTYLPEDQSESIAVNEVSGTQIDITFDAGRVARVAVEGPVQGKYRYLERRRLQAAADSTAAGPDSVRTRRPPAAPVDSAATGEGGPAAAAANLIDFGARASSVEYKGQQADFDVQHGTIHIARQAEVRSGTLVLGSGDIRFDTRNEELLAEGDPLLSDKESELLGERMGYLFDAKTGAVQNGVTQYDDGFYYGKHVRRIDDRTLLVRDGTYTSCDLAEPHYHFTAKRMKLSLRQRVVARQVTFYVSDLPIMTFPFFFKSLDSGRHSGILFPRINVGVSSREGRYVRDLGYYWATNDYTDFTLELDYNERKDLTTSLRNRYRARYGVDGEVNMTYLSAFGAKQGELSGDEWKFTARHNQPSLWEVWRATADIAASSSSLRRNNLTSDSDFQNINTQLRSTASLARTFASGASLSLSGTRSQFVNRKDDDPVTNNELSNQTLPTVNLNFKTGPLRAPLRPGQSGSVAGDLLRAIQFSQQYVASATRKRSENGSQDGLNGSGSYSLNYAPRGRVGPFVFTSGSSFGFAYTRLETELSTYAPRPDTTIVTRPGLPDTIAVTTVYDLVDHDHTKTDELTPRLSFANSLRTDLYGIFRPHLGPLTGIKHKVSWTVGHSFTPQLGDRQKRAQSFNFSLGNELSLKLTGRGPQAHSPADTTAAARGQDEAPAGEGQVRKLDRLLAWTLSGSYNPEADTRGWSSLRSSIGLQPVNSGLLNVTVDQTIDPYDWTITSTTTSLNSHASLGGDLDLGGALQKRQERRSPILDRLPAAADSAAADSVRAARDAAADREHPDDFYGGDQGPLRGATGRNQVGWRLRMGTRYSQSQQRGGARRVSATGDMELEVAMPGEWSANWRADLDLQSGAITNQRWGLRRDLHCWALEFNRYVAGDGSEFGFRLYLKQIPDVKITRGKQGGGSGFGGLTSY